MKPSTAAAAYADGPTWNHRATGAAYFDGPMRYHQQQQLHIPMGPHKTIDRSSCIYQWAHVIPSAAVAAYANGPTRNHQQQQLHIPMAQTKLSAASVGKLMGPYEAIDSSSSGICRWAHGKPSTATAAYADGPTQNHRQQQLLIFNGLKRSHRQQQQQHTPMGPHRTIGNSSCICQWAHAIPSAIAATYSNGPIPVHRQYISK